MAQERLHVANAILDLLPNHERHELLDLGGERSRRNMLYSMLNWGQTRQVRPSNMLYSMLT